MDKVSAGPVVSYPKIKPESLPTISLTTILELGSTIRFSMKCVGEINIQRPD